MLASVNIIVTTGHIMLLPGSAAYPSGSYPGHTDPSKPCGLAHFPSKNAAPISPGSCAGISIGPDPGQDECGRFPRLYAGPDMILEPGDVIVDRVTSPVPRKRPLQTQTPKSPRTDSKQRPDECNMISNCRRTLNLKQSNKRQQTNKA